MQRQVQNKEVHCKELENATASSQQRLRIAEAATHTNQSKLALLEAGLRDLRRRTQRALDEQATLNDVLDGGAIAESLDNLPQWAVALVAGPLGVYMILGPHVVFQGSAACAGSIVGGLFIAGTIDFVQLNFRKVDGVHSRHEHSIVDAICNLVGGRGVWMVYVLWFAFFGLGMWRYINGFEIALYAVVDEVHMIKSGPGGRRFRVEQDLGHSMDEEAALGVGEAYLLDNSQLQSKAAHIAYRFSKNIEDKDESRIAAYGSIVHGVDLGDGWLQVGNRYLPMAIRGVKVVILQRSEDSLQDSEHWQPAESSSAGAAQNREAATPNQSSFEDLVRLASNLNIHDQTPDHAYLRAAWESSGKDLQVAVEKLVQGLTDQRRGVPATASESSRASYAKT